MTGPASTVNNVAFTDCILSTTRESCQNTANKGEIAIMEIIGTLIANGEKGDTGKQPANGEVWTQLTGPGGFVSPLAEWE